MDFPNLLSLRLCLREHSPNDKFVYYKLMSDTEAIRYYGRKPIEKFNEAGKELGIMHDSFLSSKLIKWAVTLKHGGTYIGSVGIKDFTNSHNRGTLSCIIYPIYWNKGYAHEALKEVIDYAFYTLNLNRLQVYVDPVNLRAMALFKKLGFLVEAVLHEYEFERGSFIDIAILGLIKSHMI